MITAWRSSSRLESCQCRLGFSRTLLAALQYAWSLRDLESGSARTINVVGVLAPWSPLIFLGSYTVDPSANINHLLKKLRQTYLLRIVWHSLMQIELRLRELTCTVATQGLLHALLWNVHFLVSHWMISDHIWLQWTLLIKFHSWLHSLLLIVKVGLFLSACHVLVLLASTFNAILVLKLIFLLFSLILFHF